MPGETPDYGRLSSQATIFPTTDLGELAARLGSPITHDRAGDASNAARHEAVGDGVDPGPQRVAGAQGEGVQPVAAPGGRGVPAAVDHEIAAEHSLFQRARAVHAGARHVACREEHSQRRSRPAWCSTPA